MRFLLLPNFSKQDAVQFARALLQKLPSRGHQVCLLPEGKEALEEGEAGSDIFHPNASGGALPDAVILLGGDGTILKNVPLLCRLGLPVLGVNFGQVGYLTECLPADFDDCLAGIEKGEVTPSPKLILEGTVAAGGKKQAFLALNEAILHRGGMARALHMELSLSGKFLGKYTADGVIVATPTGSTAYNLSAGGPAILPALRCFAVTPICPVSPLAIPFVADSGEEISVRLSPLRMHEGEESGEALLTADGCRHIPLSMRPDSPAQIVFRRHKKNLRMYRQKAFAPEDLTQLLKRRMEYSPQ